MNSSNSSVCGTDSTVAGNGIPYSGITYATYVCIDNAIKTANVASDDYSTLLMNFHLGVGDEKKMHAALQKLRTAVNEYKLCIAGFDMDTFPLAFTNRINFNLNP